MTSSAERLSARCMQATELNSPGERPIQEAFDGVMSDATCVAGQP